MTSFRQNVLYICVIIFVFFGCIKAFAEDIDTKPKGVFLPSDNFIDTGAIPANRVKAQLIHYNVDESESLGCINITAHQNSKNITHNELCKSSLEVAIKIAAENGISKIKYYCLPFDEQKDIELRSFGFKELN